MSQYHLYKILSLKMSVAFHGNIVVATTISLIFQAQPQDKNVYI